MAWVRPIKRFVLLYDDQPGQVEGGVVVERRLDSPYMDYAVVAVGEREDVDFGPGDRVVVGHPYAGRRVMLDGVVYRLVRASDVIAKLEE